MIRGYAYFSYPIDIGAGKRDVRPSTRPFFCLEHIGKGDKKMNRSEQYKKLSVEVNRELYARILDAAHDKRMNRSELVREAIISYLSKVG